MKILHVAETIKGGVASVINELLLDQSLRGCDLRVLVPENQAEYINSLGNIVFYKKTGRNIFSFILLAFFFLKNIFIFKPDIVHIHSSFAGFICRFFLFFIPFKKMKVIYCPHSFSFMMKTSFFKKKIYSLIEIMMLPVTDKVICVGVEEYNSAIKFGLSPHKLIIINNGVRILEYFDKKEFLKDNIVNFIFVGRFDFQKGYDLLIEAIKNTNKLNAKFTIVGDFVHDESYENLELDNVFFTGWIGRDELLSYYYDSDFLLMPSRWEGLPMVALEAFSTGLPILSSNCSGIDELVEDDFNGYKFKNEDVNDFISKIEFLCKNINFIKINKLSRNARMTYLDKFTVEKMNEKTFELYVDILKGDF